MKHPDRIIDMHTHMFNARYLPLKGVFRSFGVSDSFVTPLARFCWFLTRYSEFKLPTRRFSPQFGNVNIHTYHNAPHLQKKIIDCYFESLAQDCARLVEANLNSDSLILENADEVFDSSENCVVFSDIDKAINLLISSIFNVYKSSDVVKLMRHSQRQDGKTKLYLKGFELKDFFKNFLRDAFQHIENVIDKIDFAWNLTHSEKQIFTRLQAYYKDVVHEAKLVHHMMDMAYPYSLNSDHPNDGYIPFEFYKDKRGSQLSRMQGLSHYSQAQLIGFSAFDPMRFLAMNPDPDKNIDEDEIIAHLEAAKSFGMIGFKFYPPMGFRASHNTNETIEAIVDVFLDYCVRTETAVFTHCSPGGFELSKDSKTGLNSDPVYWRKALKKTGRSELRLCLGHAGGGIYDVTLPGSNKKEMSYGWLSSSAQWRSSENYAMKVVNLCREFPNVYCELANIDVIIEDQKLRLKLRANLIRELNSTKGNYCLSDKIMYGTDWHMVGMVNDAVTYYERLVEIFNDHALSPYFDGFFCNNAKRYLNLFTS